MYLLYPIGADHLGIPDDIQDQISAVNELLKEDYNIKLGSPFDYFRNVGKNFDKFKYDDELRDNSKTFTLQGCYSSRLDLKRYNVQCSYMLDLASRYVRFSKLSEHYASTLDYAYKLLIKNQAHDSICGCSTDDVHMENIVRYKKILQIARTIIDEIKLETKFEEKMVINLSDRFYSGIVEFESAKSQEGYEKFAYREGFEKDLLTDINRIPVTEDYKRIYTYLAEVHNVEPDETEFIMPALSDKDLTVTDTIIENSKISLKIKGGQIFINSIPFSLIDFIDLGDSYNNAPKKDDFGTKFKVLRSRVLYSGNYRAALRIDFESTWDIISLNITLDSHSDYLKFEFDWNNTQKNHLLEVCFEMPSSIKSVYSEDMDVLIKREFDSDYDIRKNLPTEKGIEVKTNTAPMQRGLLIDESLNNIGVITKGLTQYEVYKNNLYIPILRATGMISNPKNPARTTPAGPPIETPALQMQGRNKAEFYVFFGNEAAFDEVKRQVYNYLIL